MSEKDAKRPDPAWRAAQHRIRNDLQTLSALLRLSRRRAPEGVLLNEFPGWLNGLAALYDALPLWESEESVPVVPLLSALGNRCHPGMALALPEENGLTVPASSALALALGAIGLLSTASQRAAGTPMRARVRADGAAIRLEVLFTPASPEAGQPADWPPLALSLAAEALDGRFSIGQDGEETVAVLIIPR